MPKLDALNLFLLASAIICFCGFVLYDNDTGYSMTQATVQQPYADERITQTSASELISPGQESYADSNELAPGRSDSKYTAEAHFSQRLQGGILLRFDFGLIVVKPTELPESMQPTALTTDAIITSSVRSRIAAQTQLPSQNFEIQTDAGVVTIHAKEESLDQAAEVINLTLGVPDVRQIVYTMPASIWKMAVREGVRSCRSSGVAEWEGALPVCVS